MDNPNFGISVPLKTYRKLITFPKLLGNLHSLINITYGKASRRSNNPTRWHQRNRNTSPLSLVPGKTPAPSWVLRVGFLVRRAQVNYGIFWKNREMFRRRCLLKDSTLMRSIIRMAQIREPQVSSDSVILFCS